MEALVESCKKHVQYWGNEVDLSVGGPLRRAARTKVDDAFRFRWVHEATGKYTDCEPLS